MSKKIKLIISSTRQNRVGDRIANWLVSIAKDAGTELEVIDLKEENLPIFDGPSPMYVPAQTPEGQAWSAKISDADAFVFVTAEYNRSIPATLKNAIDHLFGEWGGKPAAIVSYGYVDGGQSATKHLQDILDWVKIVTVEPKTSISLTPDTFAEDGSFKDIDATMSDAKAPFLAALDAINHA